MGIQAFRVLASLWYNKFIIVQSRRRRSLEDSDRGNLVAHLDLTSPFLHISLKTDNESEISTKFRFLFHSKENISYGIDIFLWIRIPSDNEELLDELALGSIMILNSWTLVETSSKSANNFLKIILLFK